MSAMTEYGVRAEDVGEILIKVQEDLQVLKDRLLNQSDGSGEALSNNSDLSSMVESAITKTEEGIRIKTELVLQQMNNRVQVLPTLEGGPRSADYTTVETTYDLYSAGSHKRSAQGQAFTDSRLLGSTGRGQKAPTEKKVTTQELQLAGPSPGQQFQQVHHMRVLNNPYNPKNREVVKDNYGVQLPLISDKKPAQINTQVMRGSTVEPLAVLPRANRVDPQLLPPQISEEDAQKGILSLLERGLIPPAAELTLDPAPVCPKVAPLHNPQDKDRNKAPPNSEVSFKLATYKLDPNPPRIPTGSRVPENTQISGSSGMTGSPMKSTGFSKYTTPTPLPPKSRTSSGGRRSTTSKTMTPLPIRNVEMPLHPLPPPTTPASGTEIKERSHRFAIQHGKVRENAAEFVIFKQHYCLSWGSIVSMLKYLEKVLTNYSVPIAFINGDKLADLSLEFELEKSPSIQDLLTVIVNREDVEALLFRPGRRFLGPRGQDVAASKIQATYRMYQERSRYLEYRRKKWAAGVIAISWVMHVKMSKVKKQLQTARYDQLESFRRRSKKFAQNWDRIQKSKRVIIHIPSMGFSHDLRETVSEFNLYQNLQMARLCDIKDPNVDVIYVSPVPVNEEMSQYYSKLLGLKAAIETGAVDDQSDVTDRYKIITPEATKSFPAHHMCLSTHLKYSARTLKRIKNLIRGRDAYIVTGVPHKDDITLGELLDVPVLCPEPEIAHLYSTKSGSKRIFASANIAVPPGEFDIYNINQLHECLAQLVTENLEVTRWLFKLDDEFDGRGIAYCDVAEHLRCYPWALKEAQRYGEKWNKKWAQEAAYIKIHAEIPEVLAANGTPSNTKIYSSWEKFLEAFLSQGGVIEACPPSESVTALTVDMLIEPTGKISMVSMGDQIHAESPLACWGLSVPQSSVEPEELNDICMKVAEACKTRGVVGYFAIDFVTFIHPKSMRQELWAVDLNLAYSDSLAMFNLMEFTTGGKLDTKTHYFDIPPPRKEEKRTRRRKMKEEDEQPPNTNRFAVMSTRMRHSNLSVVHYSVFFQMCRAHGIGYDIKEKQGTVFTLVDSATRENLGMLTVGDNLQGALATFARNLSVIHQEISAPNMQGESNFKPVIEDIEAILGTTVQNSEEVEEDPLQDME